jgi:hypothetical protein
MLGSLSRIGTAPLCLISIKKNTTAGNLAIEKDLKPNEGFERQLKNANLGDKSNRACVI